MTVRFDENFETLPRFIEIYNQTDDAPVRKQVLLLRQAVLPVRWSMSWATTCCCWSRRKRAR
ncbi:hypothetical protein ACTMU2_00425 [Cupriavidus basilensis]